MCELKLATIVANETPKLPTYAEIEPPPGAGLSLAVSSAKVAKFILINFESAVFFNTYSIIRSSGLKGANSSKPIDLTAILINSDSETPTDRFCLFRKYFPASNIPFRGIKPINSEPVTRIPLSDAFFTTSSNAM